LSSGTGEEEDSIIAMLASNRSQEEIMNSLNLIQKTLQFMVVQNHNLEKKNLYQFFLFCFQENDKIVLLRKLTELYQQEKASHVRTKISCVLLEFRTILKFDIQV